MDAGRLADPGHPRPPADLDMRLLRDHDRETLARRAEPAVA